MTVVKVCDVRSVEIARSCADIGVDLLGLHCIWESPSDDRLEMLEAVACAVAGRCKVVLVTRQTDVGKVVAMTRRIAWDYVQLHARWEPVQVAALRAELARRGARPQVIGVVEASPSDIGRIEALEESVDLLLFDSTLRGGSGMGSSLSALGDAISHVRSKPFLIAGGLRIENVVRHLKRFRPWGVDVQSGVEKADGSREKDLELIRRFTETVRAWKD